MYFSCFCICVLNNHLMMLTFSNWRFAYINTNCAVSCAAKCVALIIYSFKFFVFVCLCAAVYGVIKNNNLARLSSIVSFHIIYQVNLYWMNNSAHKYNYFETLFHTLTFHTNFSRIFHPCNLVPHFHVSHFPPLHFWPSRIFMSRIFSRPPPKLCQKSKVTCTIFGCWMCKTGSNVKGQGQSHDDVISDDVTVSRLDRHHHAPS